LAESSFQAVCEAAAERWDIPVLAAGYLVDGGTELVSFGCDTDARFRVASITKPFTATLAARHLDLDEGTGIWPSVRVRHVLAHTSGYGKEPPDIASIDGADALERAIAELPSMRAWLPPGEEWSYSNAGYWLAGWLAAERTGLRYEDALMRDVIVPAGLEATSFDDPDLGGFDVDQWSGARTPAETSFPRARRPGGGLVSTVRDLLRFAAWQLEQPWTDALRVAETTRPGGWWGLGFALERVGGLDVWGHPGSVLGFQTSLLLVPARRFAFVGLTNSAIGSLALRRVEAHLFERWLGVRRERPAEVQLDAHELDELAGRYANPEGEYTVAVAGRALRVALADAPPLVGRPVGGREFLVTDGFSRGARFDFLPVAGPPRFARIESRLAERV